MLANLIIKRQKKFPINLKGVLIGNGMLSHILDDNTMPLYAYGHAIIDEELWQYFGKKCCKGCADTCDIHSYANKTKTECYNIIGSIFKSIYNGISNPYDIYRDCVREAFHIPNNITWKECNDDFKNKYDLQYADMVDFMKNIIKAKVPVWAYYGDTDILLTPKTPWILDDQIGGTVTEYDGFTLLTVRGVGHMVPQWAPKRAFYILTQFLNQTI
ncbi:unnamed protein product [Meloidogyne enterolobii]|uniref:Uncharacterized protein n=1 Tax=Meloidogyne enterolobii TaxID=390850 RepID=A0ACB0YUW4_MELEN